MDALARGVAVVRRVHWVALIAWASLVAPGSLSGQDDGGQATNDPVRVGTITGIVTEAETGVPLGDVLVIAEGAGRAVRTRANGRFVIEGIPRGRYTLRARPFGYRDAALWVRVEDGEQTWQVVVLAPNPLELQGLTVTGEARDGLMGVVVDEVSRRPIVDALVSLEPRAAAVTDSIGVFLLRDLRERRGLVRVEQFGYEPLLVPVPRDRNQIMEIALRPQALDVEGLSVEVMQENVAAMNRRIANRRDAAAMNVLSWDQRQLAQARSQDMFDFLEFETPIIFVPCPRKSRFADCIRGRGGIATDMAVCIDEVPATGGLMQLGTYKPEEFYLIEVYRRGTLIMAYTRRFMERLARRRQALMPLEYLGCSG